MELKVTKEWLEKNRHLDDCDFSAGTLPYRFPDGSTVPPYPKPFKAGPYCRGGGLKEYPTDKPKVKLDKAQLFLLIVYYVSVIGFIGMMLFILGLSIYKDYFMSL